MTREEIAVRLLAGFMAGKAMSGFVPNEEHVELCVRTADMLIERLEKSKRLEMSIKPPPTPMPSSGAPRP